MQLDPSNASFSGHVAGASDTLLADEESEAGALPGEGQPDSQSKAEGPTEPAPGSNAAASLEFGRSLSRLRQSRGFTIHQLIGITGNESIKDYELGKYRPRSPQLWGLARALNVMPISIGPSATRKDEPPIPFELLLRKKGSRALRLQRLVELLSEAEVSKFAELTRLDTEEIYAVASAEVQLSDLQLEPFLSALPQVRRPWLLAGEGEPLQVLPPAPAAPVPAPEVAPPVPPAPYPEPPAAPEGGDFFTGSFKMAQPEVRSPAPVGEPLYVPLGGGLVAEVDAMLLAGSGAVSGLRLLAGAGQLPALTSPAQLERLFHTLRGVLDQRSGN